MKNNTTISLDKIRSRLPKDKEKKKGEINIETMAKHIAKLKRPQSHSFSNPLNGNSLY